MLRSPADFVALQQLGRSRSHRLVTVRMRRNDLDHNRYGIATGRKLGKAVERNRVRRRVRDILRRIDGTIESGRDILVVARPDSASASFAELAAALGKLLGDGPGKEGMRSR
jgi:ribonuclease P protein component